MEGPINGPRNQGNGFPYLMDGVTSKNPFGEQYIVTSERERVQLNKASSELIIKLAMNSNLSNQTTATWFENQIKDAKYRESEIDSIYQYSKRAVKDAEDARKAMSAAHMGTRPSTVIFDDMLDDQDKQMKKETFKKWWDTVGSKISPRFTEDLEEFAERVAEEAWHHRTKDKKTFDDPLEEKYNPIGVSRVKRKNGGEYTRDFSADHDLENDHNKATKEELEFFANKIAKRDNKLQ